MSQKNKTQNKAIKYTIWISAIILLIALIVLSYTHYQYKYKPLHEYGFMCEIVEGGLEIVNARKDLTEVDIPDEINGKAVVGIGPSAFSGCNELASVTLPDGIMYIGESAFQNCAKLSTIKLSANLTRIGLGAFHNCSSLKTISLPNTLTSIGSLAFSGCSRLEAIRIPDKITQINNATFKNCTKLTNVSIPRNMANISDNAFDNCSSLEELNYRGTSNEWHGSNMFFNMGPLFKVSCSDGKYFPKFDR